MKTYKITNFLMSLALAANVAGLVSYGVASTFEQYRNIRWVSGITSLVGIPCFAATAMFLSKRGLTQKDIDKAVLEQLKAKFDAPNCSPSDQLNLEQVIALYESTVETQSTAQQTTLYQLL